jgi:hypothetical protein
MTKIVTYIELDTDEFSTIDRDAAGFDGSTTYLTRGGGLTAAADSKLWTCSYWVRRAAGDGGRIITGANSLGGGETTTRVALGAGTNIPSFNGLNSAGVEILNAGSTGNAVPVGEWTHVMGSFDMSDPDKAHMYVNGQPRSIVTFTDDTIDFTKADWGIGARPDGTAKLNGEIAHLWFAPGVYIDLSDPDNRRKFITDYGTPANLGKDGSVPTGVAPLVYMAGAVDDWATNKGTGGGFTTTGELEFVEPEPQTWRFAEPTEYLPRDIDCIPSVKSVAYDAATISLGENLGQRASLTVNFLDHKHVMDGESFDSGTFWGKFRARFGQKLRGRSIRLIRGTLGQAIEDMVTRHFFVESTEGPTPEGTYSIVAKDLLKFVDDDRSQAPVLSNGRLASGIDDNDASLVLLPSGVGNLEYPAAGHVCIGGKEIVEFTRSDDTLTITRAQLGTPPMSHSTGDRVQLVLYYDGDDVADIIEDLLTSYGNVDGAYIPLTEWQDETAANLGGVIYARAITEPTSVGKLISELIEQAALALWWDERAQLVRLQVLKEIATDANLWDENVILENSLRVKDQPNKRISQIWTWYGQRNPADRGDDEDNYRSSALDVDLERQSEYGLPLIRKIKGRWVATENAAARLNQVQLSRFRDPPRKFNFDLFHGANPILGTGYRLSWRQNQDVTGAIVEEGAPIQVTRVSTEPGVVHVEAEEMLASGVIVLRHTVILTTTGGVFNWTVPDSWNDSDNIIECIGGGGSGATGGPGDGGFGGKAGGGGAYAAITNLNLTPAGSVQYRVGSTAGDTWFNGATFGAASVGARGGMSGSGRTGGGTGGQASSSTGDVKFSGGTGGNGGTNGGGGGGAGAAAGPHGDGGSGGAGSTGNANNGGGGGGAGSDGGESGSAAPGGNVGGAGGHNRFGFGRGTFGNPHGTNGGGGAGNGEHDNSGEVGRGSAEQLWTQTIAPIFSAGPGSGPGGGGERSNGRTGALYGAGGSGAGGRASVAGTGAQGVIAISWTVAS